MRRGSLLLVLVLVLQAIAAPCAAHCLFGHSMNQHSCCPVPKIDTLQGACCQTSSVANMADQRRAQGTPNSLVAAVSAIPQLVPARISSVPLAFQEPGRTPSPPLILRI